MALLCGTTAAIVLTVMNYYVAVFKWNNLLSFLFVGNAVTLLAWGGDLLWDSTISRMVENPRTLPAYGTRLPFWYLAGGMGYVLGVLVSQKLGLLVMYFVPAGQLFRFGGTFGCIMQFLLHGIRVYRLSPISH